MDVASMWRSLRTNPADASAAPASTSVGRVGNHHRRRTGVPLALPPRQSLIPEVSVTVTSQRPGVAAQVTIAANFNSANGSYQGPTTIVGQGQFTDTGSQVHARFVLLPSGFPVLGVGAVADYADGVHGAALTYREIACNPWVWWGWLTPVAGTLSRMFRTPRKS